MKKLILIVLIIVTVKMCADINSTPVDEATRAQSDQKSKELSWIEVGKDAVRTRLKDADSAKFRNAFFNYGVLEGKEIPVSCGEVNAKNSFGGFTGFKRYVSAGEGLTYLETEVADFATVWNKLCTKWLTFFNRNRRIRL